MSFPPPPAWSSQPVSPYAGLPGLRPDGSTKGPTLWVGGIIIGIALAMCVVSIVGINGRLDDFRETTIFSVPGTTSVELAEGEWRLMRLDIGPSIDAEFLDVDGPAPVRMRIVDSTDQFVERRTVDHSLYREIAAFTIDEAGEYTFAVSEEGTTQTDVLIVRATTSLISSALFIGAWALAGIGGGILFLIGLIPLTMTLVNRSRAKRSRAMLAGYGSHGVGPVQ